MARAPQPLMRHQRLLRLRLWSRKSHRQSKQMVDPGGLVFCVIPPHTPDFAEHATVWDDER